MSDREQPIRIDRDSAVAILVPPEQRELWSRFNDTATDLPCATVAELLLRQIDQAPDTLAVAAPRRGLTYRELGRAAAAITDRLAAVDAPTIAVCVEPGWEQVVAAAAAALGGRPLHAVDPTVAQSARWRRLADVDAGIVLTQSWLAERLRWPPRTVLISIDSVEVDSAGSARSERPPSAEDVLCLLAAPDAEGVPLTHDAVVTTTLDLARRYHIGASDRLLGIGAMNDAVGLFSTYCALTVGATLVVPDDIDLHSPSAWFDLMRREGVTIWHATPTLTGLLAEHLAGRGEVTPSWLRLALIGGEPLAPSLVARLRAVADPALRAVHLGPGGPAGPWVSSLDVTDLDQANLRAPVGAPLANKHLFVLNEAMTPCPAWVDGRIYVSSRGMRAPKHSDLGDFVTSPASGKLLYRTNLMGHLRPDGVVDVVGEDFARVSMHGHPVNLRDIEALLAAHPAVLAAAVVSTGAVLVAYVKLASQSDVTGGALLDFLRTKMSPYLLPERVEPVRAFALTPDGCVDRAMLLGHARRTSGHAQARADVLADADASSVDLLDRAGELAAQILGVTDVDPHMNLLDLGATSVQLARLATRAEQEFGIEVEVEELLRFPSVAVLVSSAARRPPLTQSETEHDHRPGWVESRPLILDPIDRLAFKDARPGVRHDLDGWPGIRLTGGADAQLDGWLRRRRSTRSFDTAPVPLATLAALLAALRVEEVGDQAYVNYPSAGGLYPVATYLTVSPARVDGLGTGAYYHHPIEHRLITLTPGVRVPAAAHAWINRDAFGSSAFSVYLVADPDAIAPMYGSRSRDYCLIEAGAMCQLLMTVGAGLGLGLCPIGAIDERSLREPLRLNERQEIVHVLLGGVAATGASGHSEQEAEMLRRVGLLMLGDAGRGDASQLTDSQLTDSPLTDSQLADSPLSDGRSR